LSYDCKGTPIEFVPSAREMIHSLDPDQPIADVKLMSEWVGTSTIHAKFNMILMAMLAVVALTLAVVGIYGMMSYAVIQRVQEIGVRMALGANATDVVRLILKQAGLLVAVGTGFGLLASIALTRLMNSLLFEVKATDATTFLMVTAVLASVALVACWIPARRAAMIDPLLALRAE
jgi:putative ABC transport system permease protein